VLKGLSDYHEEYHVDGNVPFVVHHRGSMKYKYRSDEISVNFYKAVDKWLAEELKRPTRWQWVPTTATVRALEQLTRMKETSKDRIAAIEASAGCLAAVPIMRAPIAAAPVQETLPASVQFLSGWAKVTHGNKNVLSRHTQPTPRTVDVSFTPDGTCQTIRVEGTVLSGLQIRVPECVDNTPYRLIARNMTPGTINVLSTLEGRTCSAEVPAGACWLLLVDVDGVVHVS
jgi:hypothetical protein